MTGYLFTIYTVFRLGDIIILNIIIIIYLFVYLWGVLKGWLQTFNFYANSELMMVYNTIHTFNINLIFI
jgi:hypothetical protein